MYLQNNIKQVTNTYNVIQQSYNTCIPLQCPQVVVKGSTSQVALDSEPSSSAKSDVRNEEMR